ncbi:MAG: hypothetical protein ABH849_04180 [Nanoarchaeota archaeon]
MGNEIERKFLIEENGVDYTTSEFGLFYESIEQLRRDVLDKGDPIRQGYLPLTDGQKLSDLLGIRIDFNPSEARLRDKNGRLYFTLKGKGGLSRNELEVEVNQDHFSQFWPKTEGRRVEKVRLDLPYQDYTLEVDVYTDRDLIVAEVEVPSVEEAHSLKPLGLDITEDPKYKNKSLAR